MAFRHRQWKRTVFCQNVRLYVLKLCTKNESHSMFSFPETVLFLMIYMTYIEVGVTHIYQPLSGKLSKLWCSFLLCNYVTYRRTYMQSISNLNFRPHFWKNHQGYSSWFGQKSAFRHRQWRRTVFCQNVRLYVLKLYAKNESHSMFSFPETVLLLCFRGRFSDDCKFKCYWRLLR